MVSDILGIDASSLSDGFVTSEDNLETFQRLAEGDLTAIDDLRAAATQDIIQNMKLEGVSSEEEEAVRSQLTNIAADLQASLPTLGTDIDVDTNGAIQQLNEFLAQGKITEEQANQILSSIGYEPNITMETVDSEPTES